MKPKIEHHHVNYGDKTRRVTILQGLTPSLLGTYLEEEGKDPQREFTLEEIRKLATVAAVEAAFKATGRGSGG